MIISEIISLLTAVFILPSIILHEIAHGYVAYKLGDDTAKEAKRLSLNPIPHIDIFGSILLPLLLVLLNMTPVGWAKPIPVNPYNFKNPRQDMIWVGLAGPAANFAIAALLSLLVKLMPFLFLKLLFSYIAVINIFLAIINLIPIPPLDGSRIITGILPRELAFQYMKIEPYGIMIAIVFIMLSFRTIIEPVAGSTASLLGLSFL